MLLAGNIDVGADWNQFFMVITFPKQSLLAWITTFIRLSKEIQNMEN